MSYKQKALQLAALLIITFGFSSSNLLAEQTRHIHINQEHLTDELIGQLDTLVGTQVADGYYWLNLQTGEWGYEDNPQVQGLVAAIANANQTPSQPEQPNQYRSYEGVTGTGTVTSGNLNGQNCTFVSVGGTTMKSCD